MPPKAKITKEMILKTVLDITREAGIGTVNARSIASRLQCSTQPIFTCYENMEELKKGFLGYAYDLYERYVADHGRSGNEDPFLTLPLSYIGFAKEETGLFKLLFIEDMDLDMTEPKDFYKEIGNEEKAKVFSDRLGIDLEHAKRIFLDLFLYSHGIAVLTATQKIALSRDSMEKMVKGMLTALIRQEKEEQDQREQDSFDGEV